MYILLNFNLECIVHDVYYSILHEHESHAMALAVNTSEPYRSSSGHRVSLFIIRLHLDIPTTMTERATVIHKINLVSGHFMQRQQYEAFLQLPVCLTKTLIIINNKKNNKN